MNTFEDNMGCRKLENLEGSSSSQELLTETRVLSLEYSREGQNFLEIIQHDDCHDSIEIGELTVILGTYVHQLIN